MTAASLDELERLVQAMTPEPFYVDSFRDDHECRLLIRTKGVAHPFPSWIAELSDCDAQKANARGIAALRNNALALIAAARDAERMREALEPFAVMESCMKGVASDDITVRIAVQHSMHGDIHRRLLVGDFRRAAAALAGAASAPEQEKQTP